MNDREFEVARGELILGKLTESEILALLRVGFLSPDDVFRLDGDSPSQPLEFLAASPTPPFHSRLGQTIPAVVASAGRMAAKVRALAEGKRHRASEIAGSALQGFLPQIKNAIASAADTAPFRAIKAGARDEKLMRKLFGAAYDCLPKPVQRFVAEDSFVSFCMQNREKLLGPSPPINPK